MKISLAVLAAALASVVAVAGAGANGSPYSPGFVWGAYGVVDPAKGVRYVTLSTESATILAAIRTRDGQIARTRYLRGHYGVPLVAYDGIAGGVSGDGKRLVLGSYGPPPGSSGVTRFAVLDTKRFRLVRVVRLDGSWSFDAVSPDGGTLYLTHHVRAGEHPVYRVRPYDVRTGLLRGALVDRLHGEGDMGGEPVTRAASRDGRWAYTLYARRGKVPFVHALDTAMREAYCIGIPLELRYDDQWSLRLRFRDRSGVLAVVRKGGAVATLDTRSWKVEAQT
jgi:hypothetical protein